MIHPWRIARGRKHLDIAWSDLPVTVSGLIDDDGRITLAKDLNQVQRRCTLMHELIHDERGIPHGVDEAEEQRVEQEAAHRLIPLDKLADAMRWSRHPREVAGELWVTVDVLLTRWAHLHPSERAWLAQQLETGEWSA